MAYKITDACVACGTCIDEFRKATSMSSILTPALVAALAPALARTKQSLKTKH